jgi:hypothetical protein
LPWKVWWKWDNSPKNFQVGKTPHLKLSYLNLIEMELIKFFIYVTNVIFYCVEAAHPQADKDYIGVISWKYELYHCYK